MGYIGAWNRMGLGLNHEPIMNLYGFILSNAVWSVWGSHIPEMK